MSDDAHEFLSECVIRKLWEYEGGDPSSVHSSRHERNQSARSFLSFLFFTAVILREFASNNQLLVLLLLDSALVQTANLFEQCVVAATPGNCCPLPLLAAIIP